MRLNLFPFENENLMQVGRNTHMQTRVLKGRLKFSVATGTNGNIAASFSAVVQNCLCAVTRLIVGVFFSGIFLDTCLSGMININTGLNTILPQLEVKGNWECRIKPSVCYLQLI